MLACEIDGRLVAGRAEACGNAGQHRRRQDAHRQPMVRPDSTTTASGLSGSGVVAGGDPDRWLLVVAEGLVKHFHGGCEVAGHADLRHVDEHRPGGRRGHVVSGMGFVTVTPCPSRRYAPVSVESAWTR